VAAALFSVIILAWVPGRQYLLLEGDCGDALDIVASGIFDSQIELPNGDLIKTGKFAAGQYFGLISMFTDQPAIFNYSAQTDVTLIRVDLDCIQDVLKQNGITI
jgi:CRP-like cAMP-binding protein